jgi:peptidoglycan/xylan/chitin deacetylase (PgdA/CDA1 family)
VRRHDRAFVPVLIYHHIKWLTPADDAIERGLTVLPNQFDRQLTFFARHGYHTVTVSRLVDYLRLGTPLPPRPVAITFDDGYRDMYPQAFRLLLRHRMVASFFIVPGFLNSPRYLTWAQVWEMGRRGMDIEAHTMSHPDLTQVPVAQQWGELTQSRHELEARLKRPVRIMAYPYGAYDAQILAEVAKAGYLAAFTTRQGWWADRRQLLTLPRVYVDFDDTLAIFSGRLRADRATLAADPT